VYVIENHTNGSWMPVRLGYAVGGRGAWTVFDGVTYTKAGKRRKLAGILQQRYGKQIGGTNTLREAGALASEEATRTGRRTKKAPKTTTAR
jgi:hypothetical protein